MALGKPVVTYLRDDAVERSAAGLGVRCPIVSATTENLVEKLRPLVESPELRRRIGAEGRAYVEQVHDVERMTDRLDRKSTRLNSSHTDISRMPSSA